MSSDKRSIPEARQCLDRLSPRWKASLQEAASREPESRANDWALFENRLTTLWPKLFADLVSLYQDRVDLYYHFEKLLGSMIQSFSERPPDLRQLDKKRSQHPNPFLSHTTLGGALYVDLFSENLLKLKDHLPYFKDLGVNYLHLMPLFAVRPGENDGGYAISNYRSINPEVGDVKDLSALCKAYRKEGISLALDFVLNHTADDHEWAKKARAGDAQFQDFYFMFSDRTQPDAYEANLREIFPTVRQGSFTWREDIQRWVWTTFNSYQWDLNYRNPDVLRTMAEEMLYLANTGVEILRFDAVAFIWKKIGTSCENLPEAHTLIRILNSIRAIVAPSLQFKSEAIVAPQDVLSYISEEECSISYNPMLMALLWEALATRKTTLLRTALQRHFKIPDGCTWANYLRCHDDIGWTFDDQDAWACGINPQNHRSFLNDFYTGQFEGSFARGVPFQFNPDTKDMRISGTLASLAGLEQAVEEDHPEWINMAAKRILLLRSVIMSIGGFPLLYLGEEWGMLNDYSYVVDPAKSGDSRWVHRPRMKWDYLESLEAPNSVTRKIRDGLSQLTAARTLLPVLDGTQTTFHDLHNDRIFAYMRQKDHLRLLAVVNFSEDDQIIDANRVRLIIGTTRIRDIFTQQTIKATGQLTLKPYGFLWLEPAP